MRIVLLNPFYFPYAGGIERRMRATARRLARRHEVHVVTSQLRTTSAGIGEEEGVSIHRLPSRFLFERWYNPPAVSTGGLGAKLRDLAPDVVDLQFRWSPSYSRAFRALRGCGRVVTFHNTWGEGQGAIGFLSRLNDRRFRRTLQRADRIVAVSRFLQEDLARHGVDAEKVRVVPNGVEADETGGRPSEPSRQNKNPFVLTVGRLVALKRVDVLIDALPKLPDGIRLVVAGTGPASGPLARRARRLGVGDRVDLRGWVPEEEKVRLMRSCLAYAHPARFEAFGLSVLEAMAAGAPVLTSKAGGLPELVEGTGTLVEGGADAWAQAVSDLWSSPDERRRRGAASLAKAAAYDWGPITKQLETVYEEAMDARS